MQARQARDDILDDPIGEIFLFGIAAEVGERQYGNRGLIR